MKTTIKSDAIDKRFKPFTVELEVETVQEARTLYHVFNHANLTDKMQDDWYSSSTISNVGYIADIGSIASVDSCSLIQKEVNRQGFKV